MSVALRVEDIGKRYRLGLHGRDRTLREALAEAAARPLRVARFRAAGENAPERREPFWALRHVSFDVREGEVLGIIGRNGSGKSTLLKILSRITEPTEGHVVGYGRVGSLLEVGTGFHPELTGWENIYLNGAILGMSKAEIRRKFDEIVDFAGVEKFLDTPVKRYSSGMYVRLAFAVAAHLEPEILLIDEVLAVGDAHFQKKCLGKMHDVTRQGRTVLFVSHNMLAVQDLCERAICLDDGGVVAEGRSASVVSRYMETSFSTRGERVWPEDEGPGDERIRVSRARVRPVRGDSSDPIRINEPFVMEFDYRNLAPGARFNLGLMLYNEQGILVFEAAPVGESIWPGRALPAGRFRDVCQVPANLLNSGMHRVVLHVVENQGTLVHREEDVLVFEVRDDVESRAGWYGDWSGAVRPVLDWTIELLEADDPDAAAPGTAP
jgi:lipopolysaccharide transport system ATP-binding protein